MSASRLISSHRSAYGEPSCLTASAAAAGPRWCADRARRPRSRGLVVVADVFRLRSRHVPRFGTVAAALAGGVRSPPEDAGWSSSVTRLEDVERTPLAETARCGPVTQHGSSGVCAASVPRRCVSATLRVTPRGWAGHAEAGRDEADAHRALASSVPRCPPAETASGPEIQAPCTRTDARPSGAGPAGVAIDRPVAALVQ